MKSQSTFGELLCLSRGETSFVLIFFFQLIVNIFDLIFVLCESVVEFSHL
jgi:hypothetical protein